MVIGMASVKVTVTLSEPQVAAMRELVAAGGSASVSAFVQHAVAVALDDVSGWQAMLADALRGTGGPPTEEERAWADEVLATEDRTSAA
jgi:Arc/MetJ-type ribon-helix-helix transcriptional regulator